MVVAVDAVVEPMSVFETDFVIVEVDGTAVEEAPVVTAGVELVAAAAAFAAAATFSVSAEAALAAATAFA